MTAHQNPSVFGIKYSNRDFASRGTWGKNQFNSFFPASLSVFLESQGLENVYIKLAENLETYQSSISTTNLYGLDPLLSDPEIYYSFETPYLPFQKFVINNFPAIDLVTLNRKNFSVLRGIEIKLTALPDNSTCDLPEDRYGCELVVRPQTIVYLACSIAQHFEDDLDDLKKLIGEGFDAIEDWKEGRNILSSVNKISQAIDRIILNVLARQEPLIMQPVWKTEGKSSKLAENCLDVFVWSNLAFAQLFLNIARKEINESKEISRQVRTVVWLFKMLYDFSIDGKINSKVTEELSYGPRNDKAFSANGRKTYPYMRGEFLTRPRITKRQIKEIIIGGGQNLLSPERRFDAIIFNSPELFE